MYLARFCNQHIVIILFGIGLLVGACKSTQPKENTMDEAWRLASNKLGEEIESYSNATREYTLFIQKRTSPSATNSVRFLIIHLDNNEVVVEQSFTPGYVKWISNSSIEVLSVPGVIKENKNLTDYIKIIEIKTDRD